MTTHPADVVRRLFERMEARDWAGAGELVAPEAVIEWPATGERFTGAGFVAGGVELWVTAGSEDPPAWRQRHRWP